MLKAYLNDEDGALAELQKAGKCVAADFQLPAGHHPRPAGASLVPETSRTSARELAGIEEQTRELRASSPGLSQTRAAKIVGVKKGAGARYAALKRVWAST